MESLDAHSEGVESKAGFTFQARDIRPGSKNSYVFGYI